MNKTKIWLIVATALVLAGCILFGGMMTVLQWDFLKLSTMQYETNTYVPDEAFSSISIDTNRADITFRPASDEKCTVVCFEEIKNKHSVTVKEDCLVIANADNRQWYDHINIVTVDSPTITVFLPQSQYELLSIHNSTGDIEIPKDFHFEAMALDLTTGDVNNFASVAKDMKIEVTTGDIYLEGISASNLDISVTTGMIVAKSLEIEENITLKATTGKNHLTDVTCKALISNGTTGDLTLENVLAKEAFTIERGTGDITFVRCDAAEIFAKATTGDITGSLLTEKVFITHSNTGSINTPQTITGGKCELHTTTGQINITIE